MKKHLTRLLAILLAALLLGSALPLSAYAADVTGEFTDPAFLAAVRTALGLQPGDPVTDTACAGLTGLYVGDPAVASLAGIERMVNLTGLDCSGTALSSLDLSKNNFLEQLFLPGNQNLTALDVSKNTLLKSLNVADCALTSLDTTQNKQLRSLICAGNQMASLTVSGLSVLESLDCSDNQLASLSVSDCPNLSTLTCSNNRLSSLDLSLFAGLTALHCGGNPLLVSLNLSANPFLTDLRCSGNGMTYLSITNNAALLRLECAENKLSVLDLSQNKLLVTLDCSGNRLIWLDASKNKQLYSLKCAGNRLTELDVTGMNQLRVLDVSNNQMPSKFSITGLSAIEDNLYEFIFDPQNPDGPDISPAFTDPNLLSALRAILGKSGTSKITQTECDLVTELDLFDCGIESLAGIEHFTNLEKLQVAYNNLTQLAPALPSLKELDCYSNQLTVINLSACPALERLDCADNKLEQLNLAGNPALTDVDCSHNLLTALQLTGNAALKNLDCSHNLMLGIDLAANTQLKNLNVSYNFMEDISVVLFPPGGGVTYIFDPQNTLDQDVTEYFTDPAFLAAVLAALYKNPGDSVSALECKTITALNIAGQEIESLAGLMFLTNLERLDCSDNKIAGMDISNNSKLQYLDATKNWLSSQSDIVGLRENITTDFFFSPQKFSGENITSQFTDPVFLAALRAAMGKGEDDPIGSIDCALTESLNLQGQGITNIKGIEYFTGLKELNLADNALSTIDLSKNIALTSLNVSGNELSALNLLNNTALVHLDCSYNHLTGLSLLSNTKLNSVNAIYNFMASQSLIRLPNTISPTVSFNSQCSLTSKPATCTAGGYETWTCVHNPAHTLTVNQVPALGHLYQTTVTKPTFTQGGYTTHTCSRCHDSYVDSYTDKITIPPYPPTLTLNYHQACSTFSDIARVSPDMQWKSSNEKVLKIDGKGLVTYPKLARGNTTITGTLDGVTYVTVNVTVKITFWQWLLIIFLFGWIWY